MPRAGHVSTKILSKHADAKTVVNQFLSRTKEQSQLGVGSINNILSLNFVLYSERIEIRWFKTMWKFVHDHGISISK